MSPSLPRSVRCSKRPYVLVELGHEPILADLAFTLLTQFFVFLRWLHRRLRDAAIERAFVRDMATNHLPHIYRALRCLAAHHGIEIDDPPPVRFLELNGHDKPDSRHP